MLALVGGAGVLAATFLGWQVTVEGVYFNRTSEAPAYAYASDSYDRDAWDDFTGIAAALAAYAIVSVAAAVAIGQTAVRRKLSIAGAVSLLGIALAAWAVQIVWSQPRLLGTGAGPVVAAGAIVLTLAAVWLPIVSNASAPPLPITRFAGTMIAVGGIVIAASTFLIWVPGVPGGMITRSYQGPGYAGVYSVWGHDENAWNAFAGLDIGLAICAALALAAAIAVLRSRGSARRLSLATCVVAITTGGWTLERVLAEPGGVGPGAVIGFAAIVLVLVGSSSRTVPAA